MLCSTEGLVSEIITTMAYREQNGWHNGQDSWTEDSSATQERYNVYMWPLLRSDGAISLRAIFLGVDTGCWRWVRQWGLPILLSNGRLSVWHFLLPPWARRGMPCRPTLVLLWLLTGIDAELVTRDNPPPPPPPRSTAELLHSWCQIIGSRLFYSFSSQLGRACHMRRRHHVVKL